LSRLNDYHAHYKLLTYEKQEIYNILLDEITYKTQAIRKLMCYGGLCSLNVNDMWNLFESLDCYQWQCECANESLVCPSQPLHVLYAQSPSIDKFKDFCNHHSSYPHVVCCYCQSFDHDVNSYPYYDVYDESYVRLNAMIETIDEQHEHFISEIREFGLLHATYPKLPSPRLKASL